MLCFLGWYFFMPNKPLPDLRRLSELLAYDPETGLLTYKTRRGRFRAGAVAGTVLTNGYRQVVIDYSNYYASRLIWKLQTGEDPLEKEVDHINHDRDDNRWRNLRLVSRSENLRNKRKFQGDLSLPKGVCHSPTKGKYNAFIKLHGKTKYLGVFSSPEDAGKAYEAALEKTFPDYTCINRLKEEDKCTSVNSP